MNQKIKEDIKNILQTKDNLDEKDKINLIKKYGEKALNIFINSLTEEEYELYFEKIEILIVDEIENNKDLLENLSTSIALDESKIKQLGYYVDNNEEMSIIKLYLTEIGRIPLLSKEQEQKLAIASKYDEESKELLIEANLRLVVSIAKRYVGQGISFEDLIQFGNLGLMKTIDRFDPTKGFKLSTYATWWIKQSIIRGIADEGRTIRIPVHFYENVKKYKRIIDSHLQENENEMTVEDVAKELQLPYETAKQIMLNSDNIISLQNNLKEDSEFTLEDTICDETENIEKEVVDKITKKELRQIIEEYLTPREMYVIMRRYGLEDEDPKTLEIVGKELKVTRERIRQIEARAIRKLKYHCKRMKIEDFI